MGLSFLPFQGKQTNCTQYVFKVIASNWDYTAIPLAVQACFRWVLPMQTSLFETFSVFVLCSASATLSILNWLRLKFSKSKRKNTECFPLIHGLLTFWFHGGLSSIFFINQMSFGWLFEDMVSWKIHSGGRALMELLTLVANMEKLWGLKPDTQVCSGEWQS